MAIIGQIVGKVRIHMLQNGQRSNTQFLYYPETAGSIALASTFATVFDVAFTTPLRAILSNLVTIEKYEVNMVGGFSTEYTLFKNLAGTADLSGEVLPPQAAYSFYRAPENALIEGANTQPMRVGGWRFMGIPEPWQTNGILSATAITACQALADSLIEFNVSTINNGSVPYHMYMERPPAAPFGPPTTAVPVASAGIRQFVGSQNTRKLF